MKKIAFIIRNYQENAFHGGGEKLFYNLIRRFTMDGHTVHIYCSESDIIAGNVWIVTEQYDHNDPRTMERFYDKVKDITSIQDYDFIISENITPPVDLAFLQGHSLINRLRKTKNPLEQFLYNFRIFKKRRIKYQERWIKQGYRKIFVVSGLLKQDIVENFGVSEDKIAVIYPGVDLPEVKPIQKSINPVTFGLFASGFRLKGGFKFLKALYFLKKDGYKFNAKIVYPKYRKNFGVKLLVKLFSLTDNVEFLDYQEDTAAFYNSINCLVVPSKEDTFNLAALEAMANYCPVIISNNAGAHELIRDRENGFVFDIRSSASSNLAQKLKYFIDNPQQHKDLAEAGRKTAEEYSWERTYNRLVEELEKL